MVILSKLVAIGLVVMSCILIMREETVGNILEWVREGSRIYFAAVLRIVIGIIFLGAAPVSRIDWIVYLFGAITLVSGIVIIVIKKEKAIAFADKIINKLGDKSKILRFVPAVIGVILLCAI